MTRPTDSHLSPDDIDGLLEEAPPLAARAHLDDCMACREQLQIEREIVDRIAALPYAAPSADFADAVMARVAVPAPAPALAVPGRRFAARRSLATAATVALVLGAGIVASILWSLGNRDTLAAAGSWLGNEAMAWLWVGIRGVASNLIEQPWYDRARDFVGAPTRLAAISAAASLAYFAGLLALRKLMALPEHGAAHAQA